MKRFVLPLVLVAAALAGCANQDPASTVDQGTKTIVRISVDGEDLRCLVVTNGATDSYGRTVWGDCTGWSGEGGG